MRCLSLRIIAALFTFTVGIAAASLGLIQNRPALDAVQQPRLPAASEPQTEAVKISFKRSFRNEYGGAIAIFEVANDSNEVLYYQGYGDDDNEYWSVRRGRRSMRFSPSCGTGLEERELLPGEHATFQILAGRESGYAQVGFDFQVGKDGLRQTIWSEDIYIP